MPSYTRTHFDYLIPYVASRRTRFNSTLHVAILLKGRRVVAVATSKPASRERGGNHRKSTIHAEVNVVKTVGDITELRGTTLIVLRYRGDTCDWGYSKPCASCTKFLEKCMREYGLQRVYYS
jgi:hypothetical protein